MPTKTPDAPAAQLQQLKVKEILVVSNIRQELRDIPELADSIKKVGLQQPLTVRKHKGGYALTDGHRRLAAVKLAGLEKVDAYVKETPEEDVPLIQLETFLHRRDLTPFEVSAAVGQELLRRGFKIDHEQADQPELDEVVNEIILKTGANRRYVKAMARLAFLPKWAKDMLQKDNLTVAQALLLLSIPPEKLEVVKKNFYPFHRLRKSGDYVITSELEHFIERSFGKDLSKAPFDLDEPINGLPCSTCRWNTHQTQDLFETKKGAGICRKPECYRGKCQTVSTQLKNETLAKVGRLPFLGYVGQRDGFGPPREVRGYPIIEKLSAAAKKHIEELAKPIEYKAPPKGSALAAVPVEQIEPQIGFAVIRAAEGRKPRVVYVQLADDEMGSSSAQSKHEESNYDPKEDFISGRVREFISQKLGVAISELSPKAQLELLNSYGKHWYELKTILEGEKLGQLDAYGAVHVLAIMLYEHVNLKPKDVGLDEKALLKEAKAAAEAEWQKEHASENEGSDE
jgi:ParB/RepB/Spo0J family partition protein